MSRFAIRYPYLIIVICLIMCVVGVTSLVRMPVDLFPPINIPVVVVATFYSGMPPEQIENDITGQFERMFTLACGIDHMESRSLTGVSLIKVYFQPGSNPDSAVTSIANLAMASLRYLPPGTLPPVVMKFDASSLPVCLVTLKGEGLERSATARPGPVHRPQPDGRHPGRLGAAGLRRTLPADHGVCGPAQTGSASIERDGCGAHRQRSQSDSAGGRREDRAVRLQRLCQQPDQRHEGHQPGAAQNRRARPRCWWRTSARPRTPRKSNTTRSASTASPRSICRAETGRRRQHHRGGQRRQAGRRHICWMCPNNWSPKVVFDQSVFVRTAIET